MAQKHTFIVPTRETAHGLVSLLCDLVPVIGFQIQNRGAAYSQTRPIDAGLYVIVRGSSELGSYAYALRDGVYECTLDLQKVAEPSYNQLMSELRKRVPELGNV